jgi:methionyl-tRNA synthetase
VVGYEFLNWEGRKFSTSKGVGLFSDEALELFPADYWRFYLSYILPESKDANFSWDDFAGRINNGLIANYGNLFYRVTHFIQENFDGKVPKGIIDSDGKKLYAELAETTGRIQSLVNEVRLREALKEILSLSASVNKYFQEKEPWAMVEDNKAKAACTLFTSVNLLRSITLLLYPYIPATAEAALKALGAEGRSWRSLAEVKLQPGQRIEAKLLFKKIEKEELTKAKHYMSKYSGKREIAEKSATPISGGKPMINFEDFNKLDLVVGTIVDVNDHPSADKLYVLNVDLGKEIRQLVAGLKGVYRKDELKGKQVVVVVNLEPKDLRGVRSHGMLLASDDGTILSPAKKVKNGSKVR